MVGSPTTLDSEKTTRRDGLEQNYKLKLQLGESLILNACLHFMKSRQRRMKHGPRSRGISNNTRRSRQPGVLTAYARSGRILRPPMAQTTKEGRRIDPPLLPLFLGAAAGPAARDRTTVRGEAGSTSISTAVEGSLDGRDQSSRVVLEGIRFV
ncbi:hypothetical protein B296_00025348 [Ensete ventricosum]|uniref:Uncharacterized protein n=1 Tax=Ensete ventricosum TaxID=4639 RepID=A0A427AA37_ENSVE|nr:hypothetical protein B296_00025348 [Ensete ventricosum]